MSKVIIADISSIKKNNSSFGHFISVAKNYRELLKEKFDIYIAGGNVYQKYFDKENLIILPHEVKIGIKKNKFGILIDKIHELKNVSFLFKNENNSIIIFQHYSVIPIFLGLIIYRKKNNKIFLIQYKNELNTNLKRILYFLCKNKINGIISSQSKVAKDYNLPYLVVPDYIYVDAKQKKINSNSSIKYDFGFIGIVRKDKRIDKLVNLFANKKEKVLIAGNFSISNEEKEKIFKTATQNITIIDKYLNDDEYIKYINSVKYFILPYEGIYYNNASSGVIYDCLFNKKPIITIKKDVFQFIEDNNLGILYKNDLSEIDYKKILDIKKYNKFVDNINNWLETFKKYENELSRFLYEK